MPQPTPYTRSTDFSAEESAAVSGRSTVRTAALDAELDAVQANLSGLNSNIALLQRDDGEVKDGMVKLHTLAGETRALLAAGQGNPRGDWLTATAYALRDIVTQSGNTYICALAHTSGTFATDLAAVRWMTLSLGGSPAASSVPVTPAGGITATNVQQALQDLQAGITTTQGSITSGLATKPNTTDLASTTDAAKASGQVAFVPTLNYVAQTIGAAQQDNAVNIMWFLTEAQRADVKARTLTLDLTTIMQAAHAWANGRPVYYPRGAYLFSALSLPKSGDGITGDGSGNTVGEDGTLLVSTVTGTTAAITLTTSQAHNVLLADFTLKQQSGTIQGRGISMADCYWLRTRNLRIKGFTDNLYASKSIYHHHTRLFSENSTNGVNYWGAAGTWNTDWFNNVVTFDTCRFSDCTVTGLSFKGCEAVLINPAFENMTAAGAIGCKVYGESTSFRAHGIKIITPYAENLKIVFSFQHAKVEIDGDGYVQGGTSVPTQATSIIDADNSTVSWTGVEDKDYWQFGYRLTNNSTLTMRQPFSGSIRATAGTTDATSIFQADTYTAGSFTITLTGCSASVTGTATWERRGNAVTLLIPNLSGTSNATTATLTGLPAALQPPTEQFGVVNVIDNATEKIGAYRLFTTGVIGLSAGVFGTAFVGSGVKSMRATQITYSMA